LEGYQQLLKATHALPAEITIGFEPTADYHRNVAFWFNHQGAQCTLASSVSVARAREMLFKTWDKHDRKDARLRYAYWLAAVSAIRQRENSFRYKYERYIRNNPACNDTKRKARVAVATKLARVAHALVKTNTDYRGYYEFGHET